MGKEESDLEAAARIYKCLPGKNCGEKSPCGLPLCVLFAKALVASRKDPYDCPYLLDENRQAIILCLEEYFR